MMERETIIVMVDTLSVLYYEKMVGCAPSSFADLVFASERINVGPKRGKFDHPTRTTEKTGANEEGEKEGETHAVTAIPIRPSFPPTQQCHYSANKQTFSLPTAQLSTKAIPKSTTKSVYHTSNDEHHL